MYRRRLTKTNPTLNPVNRRHSFQAQKTRQAETADREHPKSQPERRRHFGRSAVRRDDPGERPAGVRGAFVSPTQFRVEFKVRHQDAFDSGFVARSGASPVTLVALVPVSAKIRAA